MDNKWLLVAVTLIVLVAGGIVAGVILSNDDNDKEDEKTVQEQNEDNSNSDNEKTMKDEKNIVETAVATPDLSTLVTAVQAAELVEALSDENSKFTVFAPTNAAFAAIQPTVDTLLMPENKADLQNVLQYHVVPDKVTSGDLEDGMVVETLNGDSLTIKIEGDKVMINDAEVVIANVETSNGIVHVIDTVLVP